MKIHNEQTQVIYDTKVVEYLKQLHPKRVCLTSDPFMRDLGVLSPIEACLTEHGIPYRIFSDVKPNPDDSLVQEGLAHIFEAKPDLIVAVGGGSAIDLAKAIMYFCLEIKKEFIPGENLKKPTFVAVPTTAGTGSEVTNYTVITDAETGAKQVLQSDLMQPDAAVLDVSMTLTTPPHVTADTGFDALTHAVEAFTSNLRNPFSDAYALKAAEMVFENLVLAYEGKDPETTKANMQLAATLAGLGFNHSGLGICHSIAHSIGSVFHIPHGRANALVLPAVMAFNLKDGAVAERYARLGKMLGMQLSDVQASARAFIEAVKVLKERLGLPARFSDLDIPEGDVASKLDLVVSEALDDYCTPSHPFGVDEEDIRGILLALL